MPQAIVTGKERYRPTSSDLVEMFNTRRSSTLHISLPVNYLRTVVLNERLRDPHSHGFSNHCLKGHLWSSKKLPFKSKISRVLIVEICRIVD